MGFCYGGGKALRYTVERRPTAATVVCYGKPVTDVQQLSKLQAPVCGIFGRQDVQIPVPVVEEFQNALDSAKVESNVRIYDGVGHAFWKDMQQIQRGEQPQTQAYAQCSDFLRKFFEFKVST
jgi:carboxymethylenebutenolidase